MRIHAFSAHSIFFKIYYTGSIATAMSSDRLRRSQRHLQVPQLTSTHNPSLFPVSSDGRRLFFWLAMSFGLNTPLIMSLQVGPVKKQSLIRRASTVTRRLLRLRRANPNLIFVAKAKIKVSLLCFFFVASNGLWP